MEQHTMRNIYTIARCATLFHDSQLEQAGLKPHQSSYIPVICRQPGITQEQIARELHVHRSSVTRQLTALEEGGFIERRRCGDDRRVLEVYPTAKGEEVLPAVRQARRRWRELLLSSLTPEERETLDALLERLASRAEELA